MAKVRISIDGFEKTVSGMLTVFGEETAVAIQRAADTTAKEVQRETKQASPVKTGKYKKGWGRTVTTDNSRQYTVAVHNKKKPGLTHLLEHGHGGPRPAGAHPHIVKDNETERIFAENLRKELG